MNLRIHRGTHEIGGSCVEVTTQNSRLIIDFGLPLSDKQEKIPATLKQSLKQTTPPLKGILISHPHLDHYGLLGHISHNVPIYAGEAAAALMKATMEISGKAKEWREPRTFIPEKDFRLGDFRIKPYLVDHSGFDSYAFLIEAEGKKVFYSGDFRSHGRKGKLFERLIRKLPQIDLLLMEGTMLGSQRDDKVLTESELENKFAKSIRATKGVVFVTLSGQNIDRIVTLFRACKREGRRLVIEPYTAEILHRIENVYKSLGLQCRLPQASWPQVQVCYPQQLCRWMERNGQGDVVARHKRYGKSWKYLSENASEIVMMVRPSSTKEIFSGKYFDLSTAKWVYSMWKGYFKTDKKLSEMERKLLEEGTSVERIHTSGHADIATLKKLTDSIKYNVLIPIHTFSPDQYKENFKDVMIVSDGEIISV